MEKSEIVRKKTICHASVLQGVPLPITADRDEGHQVVGLAAQVGLSLSSETRATPSSLDRARALYRRRSTCPRR